MASRWPCVSTRTCLLRPHVFFPHIIALFRATHRTGFDRLTIDDPCAGLRISPLLFAHLPPQGLQDVLPDPFALPATEVVVNSAPRRKLMRQQAPRAAAAQDVEDGIDNLASLMHLIGGIWGNRRDQGLHHLPLRIREIGGIGHPTQRHWHPMLASFHLFCSLCFSLLSLVYRQVPANQTLSYTLLSSQNPRRDNSGENHHHAYRTRI